MEHYYQSLFQIKYGTALDLTIFVFYLIRYTYHLV